MSNNNQSVPLPGSWKSSRNPETKLKMGSEHLFGSSEQNTSVFLATVELKSKILTGRI